MSPPDRSAADAGSWAARALLGSWMLGLLLLVAGCASQRAYSEGQDLLREGKTEAGLAKLEEAVKLEPRNSEYRIALATQRASLVNRLVSAGEAAKREGRLADAEKVFRQVQQLDPENAMARQGLDALVTERRHRQLVREAEPLVQNGGVDQLKEAMARLRQVLAENPDQKEALNLKARLNELLAKPQKPETGLAATFRKPITLEFRDAPLRSVFDLIAKLSGLNFFFDKDIRPDLRATILARNTSIEDSLRVLLATNQLEFKVLNENSILVYPNTPQKLKEYQTLVVRSFFLTNADVKGVSASIKAIAKSKDVVTDERLGLIIVRDTPDAIRVAERIVALQDISDPEVMLDVEILEIKRSRLLDLGIRWPGSLSLAPLQTAGSTLTLDALRSLSGSTIQATVGAVAINAGQQDQVANTLANPRIRVRNREKAKILIGDRVPVISTTTTATGFVSEAVTYVDVGLKLDVEPNVYLDDDVAIKIALEVSTLGAQTTSKAGTVTYQIGTRGANTVLRLRDGETQILAGLINDEDRSTANKVPGIGELPIVGRLFGSQSDDKQRSEILLSITPRVLRSIRRPELVAAEFESGTEATVGAETLKLSTVEPPRAADGGSATPAPTVSATGRPSSLAAPAAAAPAAAPAVAPAVAPPPRAPMAPGPTTTAQAATSPLPAPQTVTATATPGAASPGTVSWSWQAPAQVRVGEQFSVTLRVASQAALRGLPLLLGFDPAVVQVVNVGEGEFLKQGNGRTTFTHRIDPQQGKLFVALVRQAASGVEPGVNGSGGVLTVTLRAVKAAASTRLQLLSATPEPAGTATTPLPLDAVLRVVP